MPLAEPQSGLSNIPSADGSSRSSWRKPQRSPIALSSGGPAGGLTSSLMTVSSSPLVEERPVRRLVRVGVGRVVARPDPGAGHVHRAPRVETDRCRCRPSSRARSARTCASRGTSRPRRRGRPWRRAAFHFLPPSVVRKTSSCLDQRSMVLTMQRAGVRGVDRQPAVAELVVPLRRERRDVGELLLLGIVLPDRAVGDVVRARAVSVAEVHRRRRSRTRRGWPSAPVGCPGTSFQVAPASVLR